MVFVPCLVSFKSDRWIKGNVYEILFSIDIRKVKCMEMLWGL